METIEVDLDGEKLTLPKDQADRLIAKRQATKQAMKDLADKAGKMEADRVAAEAKATKAEEDKQAVELTKKGELDAARDLLTKQHRERESKLGVKLRDKHLAALVAQVKGIVPAAVPDVVDQLRARTRYDFDSDAIVVLDEAGQPRKDDTGNATQVDSWLNGWLEKRPHYLLDGTPKGSGADGEGKGTGGKTITQAAFDGMEPRAQGAFFQAGGTIKG